MELAKNSRSNAKLFDLGGSSALILSPEFREYLDAKVGDEMVIVCEESPKWGRYLGIGKRKDKEANKK